MGEDQKQHLELSRYIAQKFNTFYSTDFFTIPQPKIIPECKIYSFKNGSLKMSKSDPDPTSRIEISDDKDAIMRKIKSAKTDSLPGVTFDALHRPEVFNLIKIFSLVTDKSIEDVLKEHGGESKSMSSFKEELCDALVNFWDPFHQKFNLLMESPEYIASQYNSCEQLARGIAEKNWNAICSIIGLSSNKQVL